MKYVTHLQCSERVFFNSFTVLWPKTSESIIMVQKRCNTAWTMMAMVVLTLYLIFLLKSIEEGVKDYRPIVNGLLTSPNKRHMSDMWVKSYWDQLFLFMLLFMTTVVKQAQNQLMPYKEVFHTFQVTGYWKNKCRYCTELKQEGNSLKDLRRMMY